MCKKIILLIIIYLLYIIIQKLTKYIRNTFIYIWFQYDSLKNHNSTQLHKLSGWKQSEKLFNETIYDWIIKMNPPIKPGNKVFEMGCGTGAVLKYINNKIGDLSISGSDFSSNAIKKARQIFPKSKFYCQNMIKKHTIPSNSQDHVISTGALAMYLNKDDMLTAMNEAIRITKPGSSLCFTHFIEINKKSIQHRVNKSYWLTNSYYLGIENIKFFRLKHHGDRY